MQYSEYSTVWNFFIHMFLSSMLVNTIFNTVNYAKHCTLNTVNAGKSGKYCIVWFPQILSAALIYWHFLCPLGFPFSGAIESAI
jgi:hypothetical protein